MGKVRVRHLVERPSGHYFQATPAMREAGIHSEALGCDPVVAVARAEYLNGEWDTVRKGEEKPAEAPVKAGTVAALVVRLRKSPEYADKAPRTIEELDYALGIVEARLGKYPMKAIDADRADLFYAGLRNHGSVHFAAKVMKWARYLFGFGVRRQLLTFNAMEGVKVKQPCGRSQLWTEPQVDATAAKAHESEYPDMAQGIMIAYDTSLRPSDIRSLRWKQFDGESLWIVQEKTGRPIRLPLYPETIKALKAHRCRGGVIRHDESHIVQNLHGRQYTKDGFTHVFRKICRVAGIPDELQFRDIRRTASSERADAGATEMELSAVTGHSPKTSGKILETYNPPNYERAKTAQAKRRRKKQRERRKNAGEQKV